MPRKPPARKPVQPNRRTPKYTLFVRIDPALGAALDAYVKATRPKPTQTSVVALALEEYLARVGAWPPTRQEDVPT